MENKTENRNKPMARTPQQKAMGLIQKRNDSVSSVNGTESAVGEHESDRLTGVSKAE